jgi:hypothetical protein
MRSVRPLVPRVTKVAVLLALLLSAGSAALNSSAGSADTPPSLVGRLAGDTLSAVVFVARPAPPPSEGGLRRFALQAYLRPDGTAMVRVWNPARDAYTPIVASRWTLSGDRFCLDAPIPGPGRICANIHIWGPRVAGVGTGPYVMVDGDLRPGDMLLPRR